jgi:hypothetical protein
MAKNIDVFNCRLELLSFENIDTLVLSNQIKNGQKGRILKEDGYSLSQYGGELYAELFAQMPKPLPKTKQTEDSQVLDFEFTEFAEIDKAAVGFVIGKGGENIKSILDENNVKITFGKFVEVKCKGKDKEKETKETDGYLVSGKLVGIKGAKKRISEAVKDAVEHSAAKKERK